MLWVDHKCYFGPDRRGKRGGLRLRERRDYDYSSRPPSLSSALRQLRMHVIEARGDGVDAFIERANGVTALAKMQNEPEAAFMLSKVASILSRERQRDMRSALYDALDRVQGAIREYH